MTTVSIPNVMAEYNSKFQAFFDKVHKLPTVCVAGHLSYYALIGALDTLYGEKLIDAGISSDDRVTQYCGIRIYYSPTIESGFFFGTVPD